MIRVVSYFLYSALHFFNNSSADTLKNIERTANSYSFIILSPFSIFCKEFLFKSKPYN